MIPYIMIFFLILVVFIPPQPFIIYGINGENNIKVNFDDSFLLVINIHSIITNFCYLIKFRVTTDDFASNVITLV